MAGRDTTKLVGAARVEEFRLVFEIDAPPERTWAALTDDIAAWWGPPYLVLGDAATGLTLEAKVGGRLCESAADGAGVLWGTVTRIEPGRYLQLQGSMGSAQAVQAVVGFTLAPTAGGRTALTLEHRMAGQITPNLRGGYARGWEDLLGVRLRALAEKGERLGLAPVPRRAARGRTTRRRR